MKDLYMTNRNAPRGKYASVHYSSFRLDEAKRQGEMSKVSSSAVEQLVLDYLNKIEIVDLNYRPLRLSLEEINYRKIKKDYQLDRIKDLVWMKFTTKGYLGVVAVSNDVNFDIPDSSDEYDLKNKYGKWCHTTSGILVNSVGQEWDTSFALIFPLPHMNNHEFNSHDVETGIGNYLIDCKVPIIDFYSHRY